MGRVGLSSALALGTCALSLNACSGAIGVSSGYGANDLADAGAVVGTDSANDAGTKNTYAGSTTSATTPVQASAQVMAGWPSFDEPGDFQLRRLTTEQYLSSVHTLLGIEPSGMPPIEPISPVGGFAAIGASTASVSGVGVGQFETAASFLARAAFADDSVRKQLVPCTPSSAADKTCFEAFVAAFGRKAFRRPLTSEEVTRYATLTQQLAQDANDPWLGLEQTVSAFLQSPNFLYMTEVGAPDPDDKRRYRYDPYELAARLSYFLQNDTPDETLLAAAESGKLSTTQGLADEVARLIGQPAAHEAIRSFFASLLALDGLDTLTRPVAVFPQMTDTLGAALKQETQRVIDDLVFTRDDDYRHLFDQPETFVNDELATFYGLPAQSGADFVRVTLPAKLGRVGLLGQAGVLAARDHSDGTSPTKRGLFVLTRLLCQNLPLTPPANLQIPAAPTGHITARERLEEHASNAVCAACHQVTDPVGLSLEHFDALGVYRADDHGLAIDDTGKIGDQTYRGEPELGALLHDHPALSPCLIQSLYGVAVGHLSTDFDRDTFSALVRDVEQDGAHIKALLTTIATSDGFRYLPAPSGK
jgi:Protein of unknown function (DUF1592)/Protein of unknown function (DUF1588)/Protein of unknown function (DUF1595)/Protein of unknown function (DUF1585)/Protein of unknown function (DUF1587)